MVSDRGPKFCSNFIKEYFYFNGLLNFVKV